MQEHLNRWMGDTNPYPSSGQARVFMREAGELFQRILLEQRMHREEFNRVRSMLSLILLFADDCPSCMTF